MASFLDSMTRILLRSRRYMAVSILLLMAGVVVLSAATRRPCLHACTGAWHLTKAGHMTKSEGGETCKLRVIAEAQTPQAVPDESRVFTPATDLLYEETTPPINSIVVQIRHFRSPPTVG